MMTPDQLRALEDGPLNAIIGIIGAVGVLNDIVTAELFDADARQAAAAERTDATPIPYSVVDPLTRDDVRAVAREEMDRAYLDARSPAFRRLRELDVEMQELVNHGDRSASRHEEPVPIAFVGQGDVGPLGAPVADLRQHGGDGVVLGGVDRIGDPVVNQAGHDASPSVGGCGDPTVGDGQVAGDAYTSPAAVSDGPDPRIHWKVGKVAKRLDISKAGVHDLIDTGRLDYLNFGTETAPRIRVHADDLQAFIDRHAL
ncbi:helix-turn-helix domain-containing protein [Rhodococcus sp. NPDC003318]|uniref:helix-turn-helix domain-containing protein n=1 Tax=Rhodococcus sp. NPDC003318 TaxID=3364503 RepID=UPI0036CBCF53